MFIARPLAVFLCLLPFKTNNRERLLVSWVGLRGAVPIVFATYPLIQGVEKSAMIFNIVFFIVLTSVTLQGTTIPLVAKWLYLFKPVKFKTRYPLELELSDNFKNELFEIEIKSHSNAIGRQIFQLKFPKTSLIVLINRKDKYITPSGTTTIAEGDKLLIMSDNNNDKDEIKNLILNDTDTSSK
jgi:cell volume regulation protein A